MKLQILNKKSLKIVTLLVTALLIATASAQVYLYLYTSGSVVISTNAGLTWILGDEAPIGSQITGVTAELTLPVSNGTLANFTHVLYLKNFDTSEHSFTITVTDAPIASLYDSFTMKISDNSTAASVHDMNLLSETTYSSTMTDSAEWQIAFEIQTKASASAQTDIFSIELRYQ
jgi:hypothetical protein